MTSDVQTQDARPEARERADLCGQYRPIGIGAVAAALSATGKTSESTAQGAANSNDRRNAREPLAA